MDRQQEIRRLEEQRKNAEAMRDEQLAKKNAEGERLAKEQQNRIDGINSEIDHMKNG